MSGLRLSDLSRARRDLIRLCQDIVYGQLIGISIKRGDPVLNPPPTILIEVKLDASDDPRVELALPDFTLREEIIRLLKRLDHLGDGFIDRLEVRAGIPRRMIIRHEVGGVRQ